MHTIVRLGAVTVLLVHLAGCHVAGPTAPAGISVAPPLSPSPAPAPAPPASVSFPPPSGPSRTFVFDRPAGYPVRHFTMGSRFVLYDNGAFVLQYPSTATWDGQYRGAYRDTNGTIAFLFNWSTARAEHERARIMAGAGPAARDPWDDAIGTLAGGSLTVRYDEIMQHSDFEDAVYVLMP